MYARSQQLPTRLTLFWRMGDISPRCRFGRGVLETAHHLSVSCSMFVALRASYVSRALTALRDLISTVMITSIIPPMLSPPFVILPKSYSRTMSCGLLQSPGIISSFSLGLTPFFLSLQHGGPPVSRDRFACRLAQAWHTISVQLAARIRGYCQRHTAFYDDMQSRSHYFRVPLPAHLEHLQQRPSSLPAPDDERAFSRD